VPNDYWEASSPLYRKTVFTGMAFLGIGIVLSIVGNFGHIMWLTYASIAVIGIGLVAHLVGLGIRVRDAKRRARQ
jgi:hypothetical protein